MSNSLEIARFGRISSSAVSRHPVLLWSEVWRKSYDPLKMVTKQANTAFCNAWDHFWLRICEKLAQIPKVGDVLCRIDLEAQKELDKFLEILVASNTFNNGKNRNFTIFEILVTFFRFLVLGVGEIDEAKALLLHRFRLPPAPKIWKTWLKFRKS